jgi:predicted metallo-beta-lactamase superfamily hydrolase
MADPARVRARRARAVLVIAGALALLFAMPALADAPSFGATPDITAEATSASGAFVDLGGVSASDDNGTPDIVCSPSTGTFSLGTTAVSCTATDTVTADTSNASFNVTVQDTTAPSLSLPGSISAAATSSSGATVTYSASASDLVDGSVTASCSPSSGSTFGFGPTTVNCSATDSHSNVANGSFTVTVSDSTAPVVSVPSSPVTASTSSPTGTTVTYSASATDDLDGALAVSCSPSSGSNFPVGSTTVNCSATDAHGNTGSNSFTVQVTLVDTTPPVVTVPSSPVTATTTTLGSVPVTFSASATDNIDGALAVSCDHASGSAFAIGSTSVTCSATDAHGNTGSASFTVTVTLVDTTAPVVTVPASKTVEATGSTGAVATWTGVSATDNIDGSLSATCSPASGAVFTLGATTVTCSATDAHGNAGSATFTITVQDTTAPLFSSVPASFTREANGPQGASVTYPAPLAVDLVDGPVTPSCAPASGASFPRSTTKVTCTATDTHSNTATVFFNVTVADTQPPVLTTPHGFTISSNGAAGISSSDPFITAWLAAAVATDLVDGPVSVHNDAPKTFPVGVTYVDFTAVDKSGNKAVKSETVTVTAAPAPVPVLSDTTPPDNVRGLQLIPGDGFLTLVWQKPLATDFDHVVLLRSDADAVANERSVYQGAALTYQDKGLTNGKTYRYVIRSIDKAGNRSVGVAILGAPVPQQLLKPASGAKMKAPKKVVFVWAATPDTKYYNVQIFRKGKKVFSAWPLTNQMTLHRKWAFAKKSYALSKGVYQWYVWPGVGARAANQYGPMLGASTFTVS